MSLNDSDVRRLTRGLTTGEIAGRSTDPRFYAALTVLPNPDVILRAAGKSEEIFDAIQSDSHVIGELRSVRGGLTRFKPIVRAPETDDPRSQRAVELCNTLLSAAPASRMTWPDTIWNMGTAVFRGLRAHEVIWERSGNEVMPSAILDRPGRRFRFDADNQLRVLTRGHPLNGIEAEDLRFLLTRHMPSHENPYGQAVFSSCFWPYTFKHAGFRWFVKFCERLGVPVPVGKYPAGTSDAQVNQLESALENLIEAGYIALQDGGSIDLLETDMGSGQLPQHSLVRECDRQMSKAITSQTLATEIDKNGSRAASETHQKRQDAVQDSDREIIAYTMDELFRWITWVNVGYDVPPPTFDFHSESQAGKDRAAVYETATQLSDSVSKRAFHAEMGIPMAEDDGDRLHAPSRGTQPNQFSQGCPIHGHQFAQGNNPDNTAASAEAADQIIDNDFLAPIADKLAEYQASGKSLAEFRDWLASAFDTLDAAGLTRMTDDVMQYAYLQGMDEDNG